LGDQEGRKIILQKKGYLCAILWGRKVGGRRGGEVEGEEGERKMKDGEKGG